MAHPFDDRTRDALDRPESRKWSLHPGAIGAWVAEMDFGTAPAVTEALHRAIEEENLGYLAPALAARLGEATADWLAHDQGWRIDPDRVHPVADVMAALGAAVEHYSPAGSAVIVPTPAYMPFLTYLPSIGHPVVEVPGVVRAGRWQHDLDAIDDAEIVERHGGRVFADEIHAPIRYAGAVHVPYASVSEAAAGHTITGTSASKAWNIPGMKAAQLITSNREDEERYRSFGFAVVHGAATLGVVASTAAYRDGRAWLSDTNDYLDGNRRALAELLADLLPGVAYNPPSATYLAWLDASSLDLDVAPAEFFRDRAGVVLTDGALCGRGYTGFVRMVLAMPRPLLAEAVGAMADAVRAAR
ncbi:MAG: aminotransferase class I/II-fold pyridoxal phosphate-dependent enzyme [Microbacterium sp.]|nr:aminotransferase class I/II-fold pyridoxal phosphate-dependent enzyme [Microbacterium sp.]